MRPTLDRIAGASSEVTGLKEALNQGVLTSFVPVVRIGSSLN